MRPFLERAIAKLDKLDGVQLRRVFEDLSDEYELFEDVLHSMPEAVIVADKKGNLIFSSRLAQKLGLVCSDAEECNLASAIKDKQIRDVVVSAVDNEETVRGKEFTLMLGAVHRRFRLDVVPLVRKGRIRGNLILLEDITERRAEQMRLRRAENLASLTTLAASVAHEIKNPLGAISIHVQLLEKSANNKGQLSYEEMKPFLSVMKEETERLNRIVVDFLFAVRPINLELSSTNIEDLIEELLKLVRPELKEKKIIVTRKYLGLPPLNIDGRYMKQAMLNIIENAIQAMPEGGEITIRTGIKDNRAMVAFDDSGQGIPDDLKEKIFEPYFTTKDTGTGLGLTIVYKIIREHGGDIELSSEQGKGTSFVFLLPLPPEALKMISWKGENSPG
ncbi:ATP-binding protein [Spirochaetia bacterium 38H-sp]|uniref:histidine kinase n=1 Tax=Rarispira pelagica TaxID=3141764 RepID=A0ABU9UDU4_9SPIR